jgi:diadenosine tetraphosphate (Ap4A) HIT family hydrolase
MCVLCEKVANSESILIEEFKYSVLIVGDHQYFEGYCQLVLKEHIADLTDLANDIQSEFFKELMISAQAIRQAFSPARLNYSSLGNVVPHIHFHLFPRYQEELEEKDKLDPWADAGEFEQFKTSAIQLESVRKRVRGAL